MGHHVWVEPRKVSQVVKYEPGELNNATVTVVLRSPIETGVAWSLPGSNRSTANERMARNVCPPELPSLEHQAVTS